MPEKMEVSGIEEENTSWPLEQQGLLGLAPQNDLMDYLVPLMKQDMSVTLNYTQKEFGKDSDR